MGDKNSYFPSFRGCQAISEIKQVGSSGDTTALVPRQASSKCSAWIYTQIHSRMGTHAPICFWCGCVQTFLPWQGVTLCHRVANLRIQLFSEHILRLSHYARPSGIFNKEWFHHSVCKSQKMSLEEERAPDRSPKAHKVQCWALTPHVQSCLTCFPSLTIFHFLPCSLHRSLRVTHSLSPLAPACHWAFAHILSTWEACPQPPPPSGCSSHTACSVDVPLIPRVVHHSLSG